LKILFIPKEHKLLKRLCSHDHSEGDEEKKFSPTQAEDGERKK